MKTLVKILKWFVLLIYIAITSGLALLANMGFIRYIKEFKEDILKL